MKKSISATSLVVFFSLISIIFSSPAFGEIYGIADKENGGDCYLIGNWDAASKTCFMTRDLAVGDLIRMNSNGVTLDGQGHHITGDGTAPGVYVPNRLNIKLVNLQISDNTYGIFLNNSSDSTIANVTTIWNKHGIYAIHGSDRNTFTNNLMGYSTWWGISIGHADENYITDNFVTRTKDAIRLEESNSNIISGNYVWENRVEGIDLHRSSENLVFKNNMFEKVAISVLDDCGECFSKYYSNKMGNYYEAYDEPSEGCFDSDSDGICDDPYSFKEGVDQYPSVEIIKGKSPQPNPHDFPVRFDDWESGGQTKGFNVLVGNDEEEQYSQTSEFSTFIPDWTRNLAFWYYLDKTSERDFTLAFEYLIQKEILKIPEIPTSEISDPTISPQIKFKIGMWGYGLTDDYKFADAIFYLMERGIIQF